MAEKSEDQVVPAEADEALAPAKEFTPSAADRRAVDSDIARTMKALKAQKKVTVKVQEDTFVGINGYQYLIKGKTKVEVPEQVADILEEAGRI